MCVVVEEGIFFGGGVVLLCCIEVVKKVCSLVKGDEKIGVDIVFNVFFVLFW